MNKKLYVGNLSYGTKNDDLAEAFAQFGTVDSANVLTDRDTGRSKGFGFVEMSSESEANAAIEGLNGKDLDGREVIVNIAKPQEKRPAGRSFGGGNSRGGW